MAKAKKSDLLTLEQLIEYLNGQGVQAMKVNELTIKLPYAFGTEIDVPATELNILNAYHTPMKLKAKA